MNDPLVDPTAVVAIDMFSRCLRCDGNNWDFWAEDRVPGRGV